MNKLDRRVFAVLFAVVILVVPSLSYSEKRIDKSVQVTRFALHALDSGRQLKILRNGGVYRLSQFQRTSFKVRAATSPKQVGKMRLFLNAVEIRRTAVYVRSKRVTLRVNERAWTPTPGVYTLRGIPYRNANSSVQGVGKRITFTVVDTGTDGAPGTPPLIEGSSALSAVWANDGGDKVTRDELRAATRGLTSLNNTVWNGSTIQLFGGRNETVSFNAILEAASSAAPQVSVYLSSLSGPGGAIIPATPTTGDGVFNYNGRNIELFYVRYLQIKGLSKLTWGTYDERHIPLRFQRPYTGEGMGSGRWTNRPDHDKFYPDIAVPIEVSNGFTVARGQNQSIWADVYIPRSAPVGTYSGYFTITERGAVTRAIPVSLQVRNFTLPDSPTSKTMVYLDYNNLNTRFIGRSYPANQTQEDLSIKVTDRHFQMAHRHKISLIDNNDGYAAWGTDAPRTAWVPRLSGSLFTPANGYDGPGINVGNNVFSIGTYGSWSWKGSNKATMWQRTDNWVNWFERNFPGTEYFLYLIDESLDYAQTNTWAQWINENPGAGGRLKSFATVDMPAAKTSIPQLDIAASWVRTGITTTWNSALSYFKQAGRGAYLYNSNRPASGSFSTEDDGIALRELAWGQYKMGIQRWFYWNANYYNNYQGGTGQTNVFNQAMTFGGRNSTADSVLGETGWNYSNGDGLLMYPGTDSLFPSESYDLKGPIASLRLKHWRRGIQDTDYLALAMKVNSSRTQSIINRMVPKVLWEYGVNDASDPTWVRAGISWSINPADWEAARSELADIIEGR